VKNWATTWETGTDDADIGFNNGPHGGGDVV
jgi:hypothetical protein